MLTLSRASIETRLSKALLDSGLLSPEQLAKALEAATSQGQRLTLTACLLQQEAVSPVGLVQVFSKVFNLPVAQLHNERVEPEALALVPESLARRYNVLPLRIQNDALVVVTADPLNIQATEDLRAHTRRRIDLVLATTSELQQGIAIHYRATAAVEREMDQLAADAGPEASLVDRALLETVSQTPLVRTVDTMILQAVKDRASDIHVLPQPDKLVIRYRIDGILHQVLSLPLGIHAPIVARLKVLAQLNPTEHRHPQDGQFSITENGQNIDIRLATAESVHGESVVLRLLNQRGSMINLPELGFSPEMLESTTQLLRHPHGLMLIAGPTGAGKTTTLYACLSQLDKAQRNILTIEDPVEYRFEGITQLQVSARHGITFGSGLRAIMRLDPDVILVGEIRDAETAQVAVQAALTGHLVLSSIHANDAVGAISRLLNLGVDRFMVSAALSSITAQRMVRKVCQYCAQPRECSSEESLLYQQVMQEERRQFHYGAGCSFCAKTGFLGRTGIFEDLKTSETLQELILGNASASEIRKHCTQNGMVTMLQEGMTKAQRGITTPAEVIRHVFSLSDFTGLTEPDQLSQRLARELTVGLGPVEVRVTQVAQAPEEARAPGVAQAPEEAAPQGFSSQVAQRHQRAYQTTQRLFARLYLEGLATGDFEPVFRELVGEATALSANTVAQLKDHWGQEYQSWRCRALGEHRYAYIWADEVYLSAGTEKEKTALLCILGVREDGEKELLAMEPGYRESAESWAQALRDLRGRGLSPPLLAVGDGALGLWAALGQVFPTTEHQRCWNHRVLNVQSKLPKRLQAEVRGRLREMAEAETQALCEEGRDGYVAELRSLGQSAAAETVLRDWEDFLSFYHYPKEHWVHLRTSNPIESIFSGVRRRTDAAKRLRSQDNALYLVFKMAERLSGNWRMFNGGENLLALVLAGCSFQDGILKRGQVHQMAPIPSGAAAASAIGLEGNSHKI